MKLHETSKEKQRRSLTLGYLLLIIAVIIYGARAISLSLFFAPPDRLNVVFYSDKTYLYSLGIENGIHYIMSFPSNIKVQVPGGYGNYRVGALGKIIGLEKDPTILKRTFTYNSSSFVPYFFYPTQSLIYYTSEEDGAQIPTLRSIFFSSTNTSFLDRFYIYLKFALVSRNDFIEINSPLYSNEINEELIFSPQEFKKKFIGYLYNKTYRTERKTVQILYTEDYDTAYGISQILEGNGIRVVDISYKKTAPGTCQIYEDADDDSRTANDIVAFFGCEYKKESSTLSDIVLNLGNLEQKWEL